MTRDELAKIGSKLTVEDLGDLLDAYFHSRYRIGRLVFAIEARRVDTSSLLERVDLGGQLNSLALSL